MVNLHHRNEIISLKCMVTYIEWNELYRILTKVKHRSPIASVDGHVVLHELKSNCTSLFHAYTCHIYVNTFFVRFLHSFQIVLKSIPSIRLIKYSNFKCYRKQFSFWIVKDANSNYVFISLHFFFLICINSILFPVEIIHLLTSIKISAPCRKCWNWIKKQKSFRKITT